MTPAGLPTGIEAPEPEANRIQVPVLIHTLPLGKSLCVYLLFALGFFIYEMRFASVGFDLSLNEIVLSTLAETQPILLIGPLQD